MSNLLRHTLFMSTCAHTVGSPLICQYDSAAGREIDMLSLDDSIDNGKSIKYR